MKTISLTQGKVTIVDDDDYAFVSSFKWCAMRNEYKPTGTQRVYARTESKKTYGPLLLHWLLVGKPLPGFDVDHIDGDSLNNRRSNLRVVDHGTNMRNQHRAQTGSRSRFLNVYHRSNAKWGRKDNWVAELCWDGKRIVAKRFLVEEDAAHCVAAYRKQLGLPPCEQYMKEFGNS